MTSRPSSDSVRRSERIRSLVANRVGASSGQLQQRGSPITFGIEIEAVLAFHESRLQDVLTRYYGDVPTLTKSLSQADHTALADGTALVHTCRELYPSWVLSVPIDTALDTTLQFVRGETRNIFGQNRTLRKYLAEPLIMAKEILHEAQLSAEVRAKLQPTDQTQLLGKSDPANTIVLKARNADKSKWTLTTDHTLIGLTESQLHDAIGDEVTKNHTNVSHGQATVEERVWDSAGFEMISPVLKFSEKDTAYSTVANYLDALGSGETFRTLPSTWAALQVHVGLDFDNPETAPKLLLQHLAYILVCQEDIISKLHPRNRCGLPCRSDEPPAEPTEYTDDDDFEYDPDAPSPEPPTIEEIRRDNDQAVARAEASYTGSAETKSNRRYLLHNLRTSSNRPPHLTDVRDSIFHPDQSVPELITLIQKPAGNSDGHVMNRNRGYMYNFNNITAMFVGSTWKAAKPTIEFRQHACSIDPIEVHMWVEFCFALVKLAERMANTLTRQGSTSFADSEGRKYPPSSGQLCLCNSIQQFLGANFLDLDQTATKFWLERYDRYKDDRPGPDEIDNSRESQRIEFMV